MHTTRCSGRLSCHIPPHTPTPAIHTSPAMHTPCHACPLPCIPPAMHTPCHACPLPCMPPTHDCMPPDHAYPLPHTPPTIHAPLWTEWLTGVKTLPCRNFIAGGKHFYVTETSKIWQFSQTDIAQLVEYVRHDRSQFWAPRYCSQACERDQLSCHASCQVVGRCHTRGDISGNM